MGGAGVGCGGGGGGGGGGGANRGDGSGWVRGGCDSHSSSSSSEDDWGEEAVAVGECAHRGMRRSMWALLGVVRRRLGCCCSQIWVFHWADPWRICGALLCIILVLGGDGFIRRADTRNIRKQHIAS